MATYSITLKRMIELRQTPMTVDECVGLNTYPVFDVSYRRGLNDKIIDHFWNREIGQETPQMFEHAMRRKMNEIMPLYNQLYRSAQLDFDPLLTMRISTVMTGETQADNTSNSSQVSAQTSENESNALSRAVQSDTPQTMLSDDEDYASGANDATSKTSSQGKADSTGTDETVQAAKSEQNSTSTSEGFQGSQAALLNAFRSTILNIDQMILKELESDMFMLVWDNYDEYLPAPYFPTERFF